MSDLAFSPDSGGLIHTAEGKADGLHLLQDPGLGLVRPLDRAGRLLALHPELEATPTMAATDVQLTLEAALAAADLATRVRAAGAPAAPALRQRAGASLRSVAGVSAAAGMEHTRGAPFHPMTQGKIERYHRSMKNFVELVNYFDPWTLERVLARWVNYYNHQRYHESLNNVTPAGQSVGRAREVQTRREEIQQQTLAARRQQHRPVLLAVGA